MQILKLNISKNGKYTSVIVKNYFFPDLIIKNYKKVADRIENVILYIIPAYIFRILPILTC